MPSDVIQDKLFRISAVEWVGIAQLVKVLAAKLDDLSLITRTLRTCKLSYDTHTHSVTKGIMKCVL